jgi:asparagine synthase (glutamine-hydrolysing)
MCGIVGIAQLDDAPVDPRVLREMADTMSHRGPDDEGSFIDGRVGFYHKRLSIIDLTTGHQPMESDGLTIVFNGEIYNYLELKAQLRSKGHSFRTTSDTEVILRMYAEYGPECVGRLNGMFAFLLYDKPRGLLLAARDHFGIKPLYLHATPERLLFASEIKALLQHPEVRPEADPEAIQDYLTFQYVLGGRTLFRGIRKLLPGEYLVTNLATGQTRSTQYWEPTFQIDRHHTEEYFVEEVRRLLHDAVLLQMRSDVALGTYLSGGLDSTVVTLLAAELSGARLKSFNGAFREGMEFDESSFARIAAERAGAELLEVVPTEDEFVDLMPTLIYHMDEPVAGPGLFPQFIVSRLASRHVKVCLGGQGGDEIFGGYVRYLVAYFEQALKGAIYATTEEAEHIVSFKSIVPNLPSLRRYAPMMQQFWRAGLFEDMDRRYFRLIDRSGGALSLLTPEYRSGYDQDGLFERFRQIFNHPETQSYYNKMTHYDLVTGLPALLQVEDRVSMASSLESRVPLLDHRLADLVTSMPPRMKFHGGELKYILRKAVRALVPPPIFERTDKMGFPVPLHLWAKGRSREFFSDVILSTACRERGIFDPVEVEKLMMYESAFGRRLWGLLNLELWFQRFIDGD